MKCSSKQVANLSSGKTSTYLYRWVSMLIFPFLLVSCYFKHHLDSDLPFHNDGRAKPIVALVPVFDASQNEMGWNLSDEFTHLLKQRFVSNGIFYISVVNSLNAMNHSNRLLSSKSPFSSEFKWVQETFENYEYVIFAELVEYDIHRKIQSNQFLKLLTPSSELSITFRVRVFDLRGDQPEVILQEFFHKDYWIPNPAPLKIANPNRWKKWTHHVSPIGLSHSQFCKEIARRMEDYISLSKSK